MYYSSNFIYSLNYSFTYYITMYKIKIKTIFYTIKFIIMPVLFILKPDILPIDSSLTNSTNIQKFKLIFLCCIPMTRINYRLTFYNIA